MEDALAAREHGVSLRVSAEAAGVSYETLRRWRQQVESRPRLRPVAVREADLNTSPRASTPVLVTASGHRVEGLAVAEIAELLRALA